MNLHRIIPFVALSLFSARDVLAQGREVGRFRVSGDALYATVRLAPAKDDPSAHITWTCSTGSVTVSLGSDTVRQPVVSYAIWRFDERKADTTFLVRGAFRREDRLRFTGQAQQSSRLSLRLLSGDPAGPGVEHEYDLTGAADVFRRLNCAQSAGALVASRSAWPPPEGLAPNPPDSLLRISPAKGASTVLGVYELSAVEELPQPLNGSELLRELQRMYPPHLSDAGVTGVVDVRFMILQDGRIAPGSITVIRSSHEQFESPELTYLPLLHFRPARVNGRPVKVWVVQPIQFALSS